MSQKICVVQFLKDIPSSITDRFVCVSKSWIVKEFPNKHVWVAFPNEDAELTKKRIEKGENFAENWETFIATVEYEADELMEAELWKLTREKQTIQNNTEATNKEINSVQSTPESSEKVNKTSVKDSPQDTDDLQNNSINKELRELTIDNISSLSNLSLEAPDSVLECDVLTQNNINLSMQNPISTKQSSQLPTNSPISDISVVPLISDTFIDIKKEQCMNINKIRQKKRSNSLPSTVPKLSSPVEQSRRLTDRTVQNQQPLASNNLLQQNSCLITNFSNLNESSNLLETNTNSVLNRKTLYFGSSKTTPTLQPSNNKNMFENINIKPDPDASNAGSIITSEKSGKNITNSIQHNSRNILHVVPNVTCKSSKNITQNSSQNQLGQVSRDVSLIAVNNNERSRIASTAGRPCFTLETENQSFEYSDHLGEQSMPSVLKDPRTGNLFYLTRAEPVRENNVRDFQRLSRKRPKCENDQNIIFQNNVEKSSPIIYVDSSDEDVNAFEKATNLKHTSSRPDCGTSKVSAAVPSSCNQVNVSEISNINEDIKKIIFAKVESAVTETLDIFKRMIKKSLVEYSDKIFKKEMNNTKDSNESKSNELNESVALSPNEATDPEDKQVQGQSESSNNEDLTDNETISFTDDIYSGEECTDDDNTEDECRAPKKRKINTHSFDLPPEFDPYDSSWTLKYKNPTEKTVEVTPGSGIYINKKRFRKLKKSSIDCKMLARNLMMEIFDRTALRTCSLRGKLTDSVNNWSRPGLHNPAVNEIIKFTLKYGSKYSWTDRDTISISKSLSNKLCKVRKED